MRIATVHAMQKWENHVVTTKTEVYLAKELNELGKLGWELVSVIQHKDRKGEMAWTAFSKRPYVPPQTAGLAKAKAVDEDAESSKPAAGDASGQGFDLRGNEFPLKE